MRKMEQHNVKKKKNYSMEGWRGSFCVYTCIYTWYAYIQIHHIYKYICITTVETIGRETTMRAIAYKDCFLSSHLFALIVVTPTPTPPISFNANPDSYYVLITLVETTKWVFLVCMWDSPFNQITSVARAPTYDNMTDS